ncbi:MAG: exodeoxyribonuclease VII small subunit [Cellulosilyticaceae bacterium]
MPRKATKDFEGSIKELEMIISDLETGTISLEDSIKKYKQGMELAAYCGSVLKKAEQEVFIYEEKSFKKINGDNEDDA